MISPSIVRILFAAIILVIFGIGFNRRLKANKAQDKFDRSKNEGRLLFPLLRLSGFSLWLICFCYPIAPHLFDGVVFAQALPYTLALQIVGLLMAVVAIPMMYALFAAIGKNITDTVETRQDHQLITHGIYGYIRHPLYTTAFLLFNGLGLWSLNWLILLLATAVGILIVIRTGTEEQKLIERFGNDYIDYSQRTGKFFPHLFSNAPKN